MAASSFGAGRPAAIAGVPRWRVLWLPSVGSTNAEALDAASAGDLGRLWVVAERQSGGRGRRGRVWTSEAGNLYASALLIDPCEPRRLAELPFVAALAAADAVAARLPAGRSAGIKWPNDVLIDGHKVAGILLETSRTGDGRTAVAIGIGINCRHHPSGTETPATDLLAEGVAVHPEHLFEDLAAALAARLDLWAAGAGFADVRAAWLGRVVGLGGRIRVRLVGSEDTGVFEAIDEEGHLVLLRDDGARRSISAGDVFFAPAPRKA